MALTVTLTGDWLESNGSKRAVTGTIAFDSSYDANGESLTPANIGLGVIDHMTIEPKAGYVFEYDYTNKKVLAYRQKDPGVVGGADIPLPEVTAAVNLSTLTGVKFRAVGK